MIIDSSAILAILFAEEDMKRYEVAIADAGTRRMSAGNLLETYIVVESRSGLSGVEELDALLRRASIERSYLSRLSMFAPRIWPGAGLARATTRQG